ncbi:MAG: ABC transporter permease [Bacteroidales bacterium]|nr:ABC transporter permease [Clostridium sp.]MCM1204592.1 ABC transporter permease [Bacteroidales bacterium]
MLNKLAFRNMKRSAKDYLVYILTMTVVTALMYAFSSLIFQNGLSVHFEMEGIMEVMIGLATVFIILIVAWLINYMVRFMLEKRSSEFGIYLLLGIKKKDVSRLYIRENILLGAFSFFIGLIFGVLLQQVLLSIMYSMVRMEYHLQISFSAGTILMTVFCYAGCYLIALFRCRRKFKKMNIHALMNANRQNEEIKEKHEGLKKMLFPLSVFFIFLFWTIFGRLSDAFGIILFLIGLVLTIYLFYVGLSAWIICYVRKKGDGMYRGQNLFLLRQFASKVRTMQFTMGTLTSLFTLALMGASFALMFSEYENTVLEDKFPFDVQVYSPDVEDDFADEKAVIDENGTPLEYYSYYIYTDGDNQVNTWILTHLNAWGTMYQNADGSPNIPAIEEMLRDEGIYYPCDTYMGLSDYNHLRKMIGYQEITMGSDEYLVQIKPRLEEEVQEIGEDLQIVDASGKNYLSCGGIISDSFSQDGHNGADYVIVVPDAVLVRMKPFYSELAADMEGGIPEDLQRKLIDLSEEEDEGFSSEDNDGEEDDLRCGSDNIIVYAEVNLVRENLIPETKYLLGSIIIPLFYIGLVFVSVAVTVLSVQQLSDSAKYRFRYDVLAKLGLCRTRIRQLILKQLTAYYLCPAALAMVISGKMILFVSKLFVQLTGVPAFMGSFFLKSIMLFCGIYLVYFIVTYVGFKRNVEMEG